MHTTKITKKYSTSMYLCLVAECYIKDMKFYENRAGKEGKKEKKREIPGKGSVMLIRVSLKAGCW